VGHGHVLIDGQKTTIPSYQVKTGQQISIKPASRKNEFVRASVETARGRGIPNWLDLDPENFVGKVTAMPTRDDIKNPIEEQLIVELYSR
jgi:small subunit ribosomal protein S4